MTQSYRKNIAQTILAKTIYDTGFWIHPENPQKRLIQAVALIVRDGGVVVYTLKAVDVILHVPGRETE